MYVQARLVVPEPLVHKNSSFCTPKHVTCVMCLIVKKYPSTFFFCHCMYTVPYRVSPLPPPTPVKSILQFCCLQRGFSSQNRLTNGTNLHVKANPDKAFIMCGEVANSKSCKTWTCLALTTRKDRLSFWAFS